MPNLCFPCACLVEGDTGRLALYYGCAGTIIGLVFGRIDEGADFVKENTC
ncbi:MAG: hypothetical protein LBK00_02320 [Treponema sp.]|nr:hypothetical protein [Treponema sp.]